MPVNPVIISSAGSFAAAVFIMFFIRKIRHRVRTGRRLMELIEQDQYEYIIVDSRSESDYMVSHIRGAMNIPLSSIRENLPTDKMFEPIYVYGRNWNRARSASRILDETGYFNVTCYGAFRGWKGPVESAGADEAVQAEKD